MIVKEKLRITEPQDCEGKKLKKTEYYSDGISFIFEDDTILLVQIEEDYDGPELKCEGDLTLIDKKNFGFITDAEYMYLARQKFQAAQGKKDNDSEEHY